MGNVVDLNPPVDKTVLMLVAVALKTLWATETISTSSYFLGVHVIARIQEAKQYMVCVKPAEMASEMVHMNRSILAGHGPKTLVDFIDAAQQLHRHAGILSDLTAAGIEAEDAREFHYTLDPQLCAEVDYTFNSPVWFRLDVEAMDLLSEKLTRISGEFHEATTKHRYLEL